jgi:hypothetical protein
MTGSAIGVCHSRARRLTNERWRRTKIVFREHPFLTVGSPLSALDCPRLSSYSFARSAAEHMIHPSPDVLKLAKLNFYGDFATLAVLWGGLLMFAYVGWRSTSHPEWDDGEINRRWLSTLLVVCLVLTFLSGISFAAGSRVPDGSNCSVVGRSGVGTCDPYVLMVLQRLQG